MFRAGFVGTFVMDQGIFNVSLTQFEPARRDIEIGVDLAIFTAESRVEFKQTLFECVDICRARFEFKI